MRKRVLPSEALRRLKADLGESSGLDPVVAYAADLRAVIEELERLTEADYDRPDVEQEGAPRGLRLLRT